MQGNRAGNESKAHDAKCVIFLNDHCGVTPVLLAIGRSYPQSSETRNQLHSFAQLVLDISRYASPSQQHAEYYPRRLYINIDLRGGPAFLCSTVGDANKSWFAALI